MKIDNLNKNIESKPTNTQEAMDKKLWEVSRLYEKQFLNEMVKAMRGTVTYGNLTKPNMAESIYREQLDQQYVDNWSETGGTGLSQMIYKELKEKIIPQSMGQKFTQPIKNPSTKNSPEAPHKPIQGEIKQLKKLPSEIDGQTSYLLETDPKQKVNLLMPWEGKVASVQSLSDNNKVVTLEHPWGFRSRFLFSGDVENLVDNQSLGPGANLAQLDGTTNKLLWNIQKG